MIEINDPEIKETVEISQKLYKATGVEDYPYYFENLVNNILENKDMQNSNDIKNAIMKGTADLIEKRYSNIKVSVQSLSGTGSDDIGYVIGDGHGNTMPYRGENADELIRKFTNSEIMLTDYREFISEAIRFKDSSSYARFYVNVTDKFAATLINNIQTNFIDSTSEGSVNWVNGLEGANRLFNEWASQENKRLELKIQTRGECSYMTLTFIDSSRIPKFTLGNDDIPHIIRNDIIQDLFPQIYKVENQNDEIRHFMSEYKSNFESKVENIKTLASEMDTCSQYIKESKDVIYRDLLTASGREYWLNALGADEHLYDLYSRLYKINQNFNAPAETYVKDDKIHLKFNADVLNNDQIMTLVDQFCADIQDSKYDLLKDVVIDYPDYFRHITPYMLKNITKSGDKYLINVDDECRKALKSRDLFDYTHDKEKYYATKDGHIIASFADVPPKENLAMNSKFQLYVKSVDPPLPDKDIKLTTMERMLVTNAVDQFENAERQKTNNVKKNKNNTLPKL